MATPTARVTLQKLKFNRNNNTFFMIKLHGGSEVSEELQGVCRVTLGGCVYSRRLRVCPKTRCARGGNWET